MGRYYNRIQRGMVFMFSPDRAYGEVSDFQDPYTGKEYHSCVQHGYRPWLVVSNNQGNNSSYTCNIVPITSEEKTNIPVHVEIKYQGNDNIILCEQMRTVDCKALDRYMYTVSDEVMRDVERALAIQYAIRSSITYAEIDLNNIVDHLEEVVKRIINEKMAAIKAEQELAEKWNKDIPTSKIEDAALQLGEMIEDLVKPIVKPVHVEEVHQEAPKPAQTELTPQSVKEEPAIEEKAAEQPTEVKKEMSQIEKFNARLQKAQHLQHPEPKQESQPETAEPEKPRKRNKWTPDSRRAYLEDCEHMTPQEMMEKYNFRNVQSVFQTKYQCKNALGITD